MKNILTISIASKDRSDDLEFTLQKIHAFGLSDCPLILCDDGSCPPLDPPSLRLFLNAQIIRNEVGKRQALARNQIAKQCKTPYLLQLDDDSYPVSGDIEALLKKAQETKNWLAFALPFDEPRRGRICSQRMDENTWVQVQSFVGCSALINVETFNRLGGYADWIERTGEEEELCMRGLIGGLCVWQVGNLRLRHEVSPTVRNTGLIAERSLRNWALIWMLHAPKVILPWRLGRLLLASILHSARSGSLSPLKGYLLAWVKITSLSSFRLRLPMTIYKKWMAMPHALSFLTKESK